MDFSGNFKTPMCSSSTSNDDIKTEKPSLINSKLARDDVQRKLLLNFSELKDEEKLNEYYSKYDFNEDEKSLLDVWEKILIYLYDQIFGTFALKYKEIKVFVTINNREPEGLNEILQDLLIHQIFIKGEDIKSIEFYKMNFPDLYSKERGDGKIMGWLRGIKNVVSTGGGIVSCCKDKKEEEMERELPIRKDFSEEDKYKKIDDNCYIINYKLFHEHCMSIKKNLEAFMKIKDNNESNDLNKNNNNTYIVSQKSFKSYIIKVMGENQNINLGNDEKNYEAYGLKYGSLFLDESLRFLEGIKEIKLFTITLKNKKLLFIKRIENSNNYYIEPKDEILAIIFEQNEMLTNNIKSIHNKIEDLTYRAKIKIVGNEIDSAKKLLKERKEYNECIIQMEKLYKSLIKKERKINNAVSDEEKKSCIKSYEDFINKNEKIIDCYIYNQKEYFRPPPKGMNEFGEANELNEKIKEIENLIDKEKNNDNDKDDIMNPCINNFNNINSIIDDNY